MYSIVLSAFVWQACELYQSYDDRHLPCAVVQGDGSI